MNRKRLLNGIISVLVIIFMIVFPIFVFKVIPPTNITQKIVLTGIILSTIVSGLLHLNIGLFYSSIILSYRQQKEMVKQYPILLNILYSVMIVNFVILLKYALFMSFMIEQTVFWKIILFTMFMII